MVPLARVFNTTTFSLSLPFLAVLFVGCHKLHPDSWLLLTTCWLSFLCGWARDVHQGEMLQLLWRCLAVDEDLVGSRSAAIGVELFGVCGLLCVLGFNFWLALCSLFFGLVFGLFICIVWALGLLMCMV